MIDLAKQALEALENSRQFIVNGVEFGYIRMPDADTPDSAHETLPEIEAAIAALRSYVESGGGEPIPTVQKTAPERIWLCVSDEPDHADAPFHEGKDRASYGEGVTWSDDQPVAVTVPYVRADLATHPAQGVGE